MSTRSSTPAPMCLSLAVHSVGRNRPSAEYSRLQRGPIVSELVPILAGIAVVAFVIGRQLIGEPLRGKRVVLLPVILTVVGAANLGGKGRHLQAVDVVCLLIGGLAVAGIGLAQGRMLQLESRAGALWAQMPIKGLWLWLAVVVSRLIMTVVADGVNAKVAASSATILLMLGVNRLAQAAVVMGRSVTAGIPFAPEKDGTVFLARLTDQLTDRLTASTRPSAESPDR
jgi:hypothetical protein